LSVYIDVLVLTRKNLYWDQYSVLEIEIWICCVQMPQQKCTWDLLPRI